MKVEIRIEPEELEEGGGKLRTGCVSSKFCCPISAILDSDIPVAALEGGCTFGYALMEPPIPTAVPMKLSPASAAIAPMANSRPVSTHSTASMVSSTPKKAIIVGTLGWKFVDGKESMESMSTPCPVELPAQPLPPLNVRLRRSNPPIVIVATFQVIAFVSKHLEPLQSASKRQ